MDRPLHANFHCRHYEYVRGMNGGPRCDVGVDLSAPAATKPCMPERTGCPKRQEFTKAERAAWDAYKFGVLERMAKIMVAIPGSSRDRKDRGSWGNSGSFGCPACDWGVVKWSRAPNNGHLWAACSTPNCFQVME